MSIMNDVQYLEKVIHASYSYPVIVNRPTTTRVKISQNFDILPRVCLVHLKVEHCQTLRVVHVRTFTGQNVSTVFDW